MGCYRVSIPSLSVDGERIRVTRLDGPLIRDLVRVGTQELPHRYMGSCPDYTQPGARDPLCAACKAIRRAEWS